jgi:hypothetical protein
MTLYTYEGPIFNVSNMVAEAAAAVLRPKIANVSPWARYLTIRYPREGRSWKCPKSLARGLASG